MKKWEARETKETKDFSSVRFSGEGKSKEIDTQNWFLLIIYTTLFAFHGNFDLIVKCAGDLEVITHHTIEDLGIALLGSCLKKR